MTARPCPSCSVVSVVPHQSQQACIQALRDEIERVRQVLERRNEPLIADAVRHDLRPRRSCASSDGNTKNAIRVSLRCALDS